MTWPGGAAKMPSRLATVLCFLFAVQAFEAVNWRAQRLGVARADATVASNPSCDHAEPVDSSSDATLESLRRSIDNFDAAIIHLLAERFKTTMAVGEYKAKIGLPASDAGREERQVQRLRELAQESGLDPEFSEKFLRFVIDEVINHHKRIAETER
eukprot:CAMPEP_0197400242 /NCGR_PEP_ID=MMETSP1165-20131217/16572_1 /TAXON_ID=284809 /ORGANISM="Chrysocystis fragilis, Strain CCMP3189" /LENGTH=155 /DNA_ID=CAMNT_0042926297 /DNA_START=24 /DNA_END=491 /DNA_ORIENTATION=-